MLNTLLLLQWSDNKSTLHKTTTRRKMYFVSFCSRFIDRFAPCVLFRSAMWAHQFTVTLTCTTANGTVAIDVLVVVYNKTWENRVMLTLHGQLVLDIRPRVLTEDAKVDSSSTRQHLPSSDIISAEYPALPDHDSMNNPSICHALCLQLYSRTVNMPCLVFAEQIIFHAFEILVQTIPFLCFKLWFQNCTFYALCF